MGINIILYKKTGVDIDDYYGNLLIVERQDWWDSIRQAGDRDFNNNIEWVYAIDDDDLNPSYKRPKDIDAAISWVNNNLTGKRKDDYINVLEKMKTDINLLFLVSY